MHILIFLKPRPSHRYNLPSFGFVGAKLDEQIPRSISGLAYKHGKFNLDQVLAFNVYEAPYVPKHF